jgi:hypothetical protein
VQSSGCRDPVAGPRPTEENPKIPISDEASVDRDRDRLDRGAGVGDRGHQQRAQSSAIKDLGAMFVTDHTAALAQVTAVASQLGVDPPDGLGPKQQAVVDRLQSLNGEEFDAVWLRAQLVAHRKALILHLRAAIRGENDAIRTLGQGALPVITKHLGELIDLAGAGTRAFH